MPWFNVTDFVRVIKTVIIFMKIFIYVFNSSSKDLHFVFNILTASTKRVSGFKAPTDSIVTVNFKNHLRLK